MRMSTNYNQIEGLEHIDAEDLVNIEIHAKLLELEECYDLLFIEADCLSEHEKLCTEKAHRRGRKIAIADAGKHLFNVMQTRNGTQACMEYLKQFSGTFSMDITPSAGTSSGFVFNVNMPEKSDSDVSS